MRITIAHKKSKTEVMQDVDRAIGEAFRALALSPIELVDQQRAWAGSVMTFSMIAKMGFLKNTIRGTVEVTDTNVTIEADLGMLNHLASGKEITAAVESRLRRLLT